VLHADSGLAGAKRVTSLEEEMRGNPIFSLSSGSRVAFVLHHVLGYSLEQSALLVEMNDKTFRAQLRSAYVEMTSDQLRHGSYLANIFVQSAMV
jgi:DNA-directed RNA polymerase specialized sigma24 family protein